MTDNQHKIAKAYALAYARQDKGNLANLAKCYLQVMEVMSQVFVKMGVATGKSPSELFAEQDLDFSHPSITERQTHMHPATESMMKNFRYKHLPPHLQEVSKPICEMAKKFAGELTGPELTAGLRKLLEAKDCFVRAALEGDKPKLEEDAPSGD